MKKFISMVMAAAMVVSLVPATAFAANTAVFKVQDAIEWTEDEAEKAKDIAGPQIQIIMQDVDTKIQKDDKWEITLDFDNAELQKAGWVDGYEWGSVYVVRSQENGKGAPVASKVYLDEAEVEDTSITFTIHEAGTEFTKGDMIVIPVDSDWKLTSDSEGTVATVTVSGDFGESEAMPVASVLGEGLDVTVAGKVVEVAEEELVALKKITIESVVGKFASKDEIKVKIDKGFEFVNVDGSAKVGDTTHRFAMTDGYVVTEKTDGNVFVIKGLTGTKVEITGLVVEAVDAKAGDIGSIIVSAKDYEGDQDEAVEVIADAVTMTVDEDEDVPVMYSGTNTAEKGLTSNEDHKGLEVTIKESVADAWDTVDGFTLTLPEGVYVTDVAAKDVTGNVTVNKATSNANAMVGAFEKAYKDGEFEYFDFGRRAFSVADGKKAEIAFTFELVAEPEFEGDVVLTLEGDAFETQEVVIAKFVKAYTVEAAQNDLVIDYKETVVPTSVVITEAEEGLWAKTTNFTMSVEDIKVEDSNITVNEDDSDMEIKDNGTSFTVKKVSDDEVAVVTLDGVELYMERNIPAGAYDLDLTTTMLEGFMAQTVFGATDDGDTNEAEDTVRSVYYDNDKYYWETVKEGWVNVITAGRDQDDASFTKKVVVPVGAMEIVAGEDVVALDVPAYINAAGYTMLPVRAVAVALGINTNNVIWDQATKTVTILYGQRIITMTVGQKVINVNGSAIPASAAVEVVNGRTFLGLRDLATALGVVDITWDAATQTATLNGNV